MPRLQLPQPGLANKRSPARDSELAGHAIGEGSADLHVPTVAVGLLRYGKNGSYEDKADLSQLVLPMGLGSIVGAVIGGYLVPFVPAGLLKIGLGAILIVSAVRIFRHTQQ